jgi:protein-L-isoaspartate(D-aspartate) O-methyltransferase
MSRRPGFPARLPGAPAAPAERKPATVTVPATAPRGLGLDSQAVRANMVQKIAAQGVSDARVLAAMNAVERHRFVDSALVN